MNDNNETSLDAQNQPSFLADVIGRLSSELNKKLEDIMIEGLKLKGFEFKNKIELENFIKAHCRCEDNIDLKERIYFVKDIPFFLHKYEIEMDTQPFYEERKYSMTANYGRYAYL